MCLAQGHNTVMLVRLEPAAPQSFESSTLCSPSLHAVASIIRSVWPIKLLYNKHISKARIFLLVDLREFFFSDLGSGGRKKINKKALKMTS